MTAGRADQQLAFLARPQRAAVVVHDTDLDAGHRSSDALGWSVGSAAR